MKRYRTGAAVLMLAVLLGGCTPAAGSAAVEWADLAVEDSLALQYANQFSVDYYTGGYAQISIADGSEYLVIPEGTPVPDGLADTVTVLQQPLDRIYLVATSAMDLFCALDGAVRSAFPARMRTAGISTRQRKRCRAAQCCTQANTVRLITN